MPHPISDLLNYQLRARHCPGALAHVERDGRVLAREAVGLVRHEGRVMHWDARFRLASLTKPVVSVAVLQLVDEGRLDLDAPVGALLPALADLRLADGRRPQRAPTVRDLLRHTSGLAYPFEVPDPALRAPLLGAGLSAALNGLDSAGFLARLAALPLVAEPGTVFRYGYSTDVLGCLVEALDGQPLGAALQRRLLGPLGMAGSGFSVAGCDEGDLAAAFPEDSAWHATIPPIGQRPPGQPAMDSGGGGLVGRFDDYAAFARLLAHGGVAQDGPARGQRLLSEAMLAAMFRNQLPSGVDGPHAYTGPGFGFGLGLAVRGDAGPAAMPCSAGEGCWSGISGTALFVQPRERWFALLFSANMASRMMARMEFRRAAGRL